MSMQKMVLESWKKAGSCELTVSNATPRNTRNAGLHLIGRQNAAVHSVHCVSKSLSS